LVFKLDFELGRPPGAAHPDIQPEIHSTDTHGTNNLNFALLHVFGDQFAPRNRHIYDKFVSAPD
jgi:hypothetical protein